MVPAVAVGLCRIKGEVADIHKVVEERVKELKQLQQLRQKDYEKSYDKVGPLVQRHMVPRRPA